MSQKPARQRVSVACTTCRQRRSRCDGQLPECGACVRIGRQCEYPHETEKRKPPTKRYIEALHARIQSLEQQVRAYQPGESSDAIAGHGDANVDVAFLAGNPQPHSTATPPQPLGSVSIEERGRLDDLTETLGQLDVAEDGHLRYFGAPSYFNLLGRATYDIATSPEQDFWSMDAPHLIDVDLSLETQTHLLNLYWKWQNPWQYLVHRTAFNRAVERGVYDEYCTPLLLRCVLALGARYCDHSEARSDPSDANSAGDFLVAQAKDILSTEIEHPSTSTAAALAILSLREMSVNKESLGWIYIGIAVRIAYNLGLNLDCQKWVHQKKITEEEAEIRRITWWGCYLLDKLFNIGLGRPSMIRESDITASKPSLLKEEEYLTWIESETDLPADLSASRCITNLRCMTTMFQTACPTLDKIYGPNRKLSREQRGELAAKTYVDLTGQYSNLPSFLKLPQSAKTPRPAHVYSLHLQYYTILILLHRPFLRQKEQSVSQETPSISHYQICKSSAEMISTIMKAYRSNYTLRRIPISTVHAVGTASVMHLLEATSSDTKASHAAIRQLKFNLSCLEEMSTAWSWSLRAIRSLQILAEEWAVNEKLQAQQSQKSMASTSTATRPMTETDASIPGLHQTISDHGLDTHTEGPDSITPAMFRTSPENIDWLLAFDSGFVDDVPMDFAYFNQDLWDMDAE